jgi:streptogramin lyase
MRLSKITVIIFLLIIFQFLMTPLPAIAERGTVPLQETDLFLGGSAAGIVEGLDGTLLIVDRVDELWVFNPETGAYREYWGIYGNELMDVVQTTTDTVWWTISDTVFGSLNLDNNAVQYWDLSFYADIDNPPNLNAIVFYKNLIWIAPFYGSTYGMLSFDPTPGSYEICLYEYGLNSSDMVMYDGLLWMINWSNDSLMSMDPETGRLVKYATGRDIHTYDANLRADGDRLLWTEDALNGAIVSFDPLTRTMTAYNLPAGVQPRNIFTRAGKIWYADANGSFGRLDPAIASGVSSKLVEEVLKTSITPTCIALGAPQTGVASRELDGVFAWEDIESLQTSPLTGIQSYSLPENAEPFGIAGTMDYIWLTDPGRQQLIRMPLESEPGGFSIYLPLILK